MEQDRISVIIPIYNVEKYLKKCVESVQSQTYRNLEILLVDDGSPDRCPTLCDLLAEGDERIRVIHKENGGLSSARNAGIDAASGEYLFFLDSDDYIVSDTLEKLYHALQDNNADVSLCDYARVDEQGAWLHQDDLIPGQVLSREQALELVVPKPGWWRYSVAWNKLYKRKIFAALRFPEGKIHEDEFVAHHVLSHCQTVATVPERLYMYIQRSGSIMASGVTVKELDAVGAFLDRYDFYRENGYKKFAHSCLDRAYNKLWQVINEINVAEYGQDVQLYVRDVSSHMLRQGNPQSLWLWYGFLRKLWQDKKELLPDK